MNRQIVIVRGKEVVIYHYELFLGLLKDWKAQGVPQEEIEDLLLS